MGSDGLAPSGQARIYHEMVGEGEPVVFIHAGIADSRMWGPQFEEVPDGFQFVRVDLRGFGRTEVLDEPYMDYEDVLAVMDHLGIADAVMVGCSIGAAVTLHVAAFAPHRLTGMVLIGADVPGFEPSSRYESPQWADTVAAFQSGDINRVAELEAEIWVVGRGRTRADVDSGVFELVQAMDLEALRAEARRDEVRKTVGLETMPDVEVPTLVIVGEHDLPQLIEASDHLHDLIPRATKVRIGDAAHLPSLEQPETFNRVFYEFLRS